MAVGYRHDAACMTVPELTLGSSSRAFFCRACERETRWLVARDIPSTLDREASREAGEKVYRKPYVEWQCFNCGRLRLALADAHDAANIVSLVVAEYLRKHGPASLDCVGGPQDAEGELYVELWTAWAKWKPGTGEGYTRPIGFTYYATMALRHRLLRLVRNTVGGYDRVPIRPLAVAESLDVPVGGEDEGGGSRLERALGRGQGDFVDYRSPDLARALAEGNRRAARGAGAGRGGAPERSPAGDSRAAA